jgi:hypothetical protein
MLTPTDETLVQRLLRKITPTDPFNFYGNTISYPQIKIVSDQKPLIIFPGGGVFFWWQV